MFSFCFLMFTTKTLGHKEESTQLHLYLIRNRRRRREVATAVKSPIDPSAVKCIFSLGDGVCFHVVFH